ncbi:FmdB family transcriptional regulator [Synoicihabitans lomoniglobus]|uniref:FmdB family transcriptional regulator n=1 Tax=Synoicihabitans lomoniglobus TaxID=2909285 RepID=A0AAF0CQZ1_9BACT|nr:FmdB family transcriptional regulator [Opitutaceae bacterium LMO-M01]WED66440.1 FmdB family transcriptional regulator [Opitutaceae bacterium LMO-M01]
MPIYEYYCPNNNTVYQFYAKSLAQGELIPRCPDNPRFRMRKMVSGFAITKPGASDEAPPASGGDAAGGEDDARMEAAMAAMESEFSNVDENDPKAMGRMMRRMAEMTGEKLDGEMEEVVRKLEEGADPDSLEEQLGGDDGDGDPMGGMGGMGGEGGPAPDPKEPRHRFRSRSLPPRRDPKLYDYE